MSNNAAVVPGLARVLVVDDSLVIRKAIEKKLQNEFELVMAGDGETGWDILQRNDVRVLVTDIEMPGLDGCAFISRIRASSDPRIRDIPIIAMTGAEDEETKERVLARGATDFLVKPIDPMQLLARVHSLTRLDLTTRQLAASQAALKDQSTLDPLTGLSSRRYFQQSCQQNLAYAVRHGQGLALIRMEIDGFKSLYRQYGDDMIDQVLVWLAGIFAATCRREDTVARIGGAEFGVVAPGTDQEKTRILCRRLCDAVLAKPYANGAVEIPITLSVGAVIREAGDTHSYEDLMHIAERRTRAARHAGGHCVVVAEQVDAACVKELSLDAPAIPPVPLTILDESIPVLPGPVLPEVMEPSGLELEGLAFPQDLAIPYDVVVTPPPDPTDLPGGLESLSLDDALQRLAKGEGDSMEPWLDTLARRLLPLLEFYNDRREGVLAAGIAHIKSRCRGRE